MEYRPSLVAAPAQSSGEGEKRPETAVESLAQALEERFREQRGLDLGAGMTLTGPPRDDFAVLREGRPVQS